MLKSERIGRGLAVAAAAGMMLWPAMVNGYPLLYPDSMSYLGDGRPLWQTLFLHRAKGYGAMRSEIYSLGIFPFHWNWTAWAIIALQALLTSYVLWLVVRAFTARRVVAKFLLLAALLSLTTSLAWYVCVVMPDILGPVLYLAIFLFVFAGEKLSVRERWLVAAIAWWAMAAHSTHLMLAAGLCVWLGLLLMLHWPPMRARGRALGTVAALLLLVALSQMALHKFLTGKATLYGDHMPYLTARIVADGPGRWYLQQHCATLKWAICYRVDDLPDNDDDFLWGDGGVWAGATGEQQQRMLREEMPLVVGAVREYPRAQMQRSAANFWQEFTDFGLWDFTPNEWMNSEIDKVIPGAFANYQRTRQAQRRLPDVFFTSVLVWTVGGSALAILVCVPVLWRRRRWLALGLVTVVVPVVFANALLTAVFSEPDSRYQSRLIWLVPLTAGLIAMDLLATRRDVRE